jgi:tetratricopeptide (TPR) repeat protein
LLMNLNDKEILFNSLYGQACKTMEGLIILNNYKTKSPGFFGKKRINKAIQLFDQALEVFPQHWQSLFFIGKLYQRLQQHEKAMEFLDRALELQRFNHALLQEASLEAMHLELISKGIKYSGEAIELRQNDPILLGNHALNLLIGGLDEAAIETIDKALVLDPSDKINQRIKIKIMQVISGKISRPSFSELTE